MSENKIATKTITELLGLNFYIPDYQRGYRWTHHNVLQLLNDIWEYRYGQESDNRHTFYCLQPIVVRESTWEDVSGQRINGYELIDGQQRLTTIHRILTCILLERYGKTDLLSRGYKSNLFSIYYKTRPKSKDFLDNNSYDASNPDLYYMSEAYESIKKWFYDTIRGIPDDTMDEVRRLLLPFHRQEDKDKGQLPEWSVQVIWYEIKDKEQKSEELFTRLNRGKIPLTSAELIKAKFVNADSFKGIPNDDKLKRRTQLVQIWDEIENQLNNPKFWAFISNESLSKYSNKIEYLFDIISNKNFYEKDTLFSFLHFFNEKESAETLWEQWIRVEEIYRSLLYWYSDKKYYHKIGFLIATGTPVGHLVKIKKNHTKSEFESEIDKLIGESIPDNWEELRYDRRPDVDKIIRVLLLTNIELARTNLNSNEFFPFEMYKRITKSLEHVHAQNIEGINENKREEWFNWLRAHQAILLSVAKDKEAAEKLLNEIKGIDEKTYRYEEFKNLADRLLDLIPNDNDDENGYLHKIENMALLGLTENISLSNSVYEVKRRKIMNMDQAGAFIPLATKRVFLKYYTSEDNWQYSSVWTKGERAKYKVEIARCVEQYKPVNTAIDEN
jgi:uncharacterized protein with ParB-like and HNH nuclease domain